MTEEEKVVVPKDGVWEGTTMRDYVAWPVLSSGSPGKLRLGTLAWVKESVGDGTLGDGDDGGDGSAAKTLGTVVHSAILEPDDFEATYLTLPTPDPDKHRTGKGTISANPAATKDYKDECAALAKANPEKTLVDAGQYAKGLAMRDHVLAHPEAKALLEAPGLIEASIIVTDPTFGLRWKLRPDKVIPKVGCNLSIKTARNARPDVFNHDFFTYQYHIKEAIYRMLLPVAGIDVRHSWMLVLESGQARDIALFNLSAEDGGVLDLGRELALHYMKKLADATEADEWPGIAGGIIDLYPPHYIFDRVAEELIAP